MKRRTITALLTIVASIMYIVFINVLLFSVIPPQQVNKPLVRQAYIVSPDDFHPEPRERIQFITSVVMFPFSIAAFLWVYNRFASTLNKREVKLLFFSVSFIVGAFGLWLLISGFTYYRYVDTSILQTRPLLTFLFLAWMFLGMLLFEKISDKYKNILSIIFYFIPGLSLIFVLAQAGVFSDSDPYVPHLHFVAYFDAVVQTYLGKTLLVNNIAQYGLYPLFLKPIFMLTGLSVYKFTLIIALMKSLAFLSILVFIWLNIKNKWVAFCGFISFLFYLQLGIIDYKGSVDLYFQYNPHRTFFPQVFLLLMWFYVYQKANFKKKLLYYFICLFCALAIFWNPDTGLIVFITWILSLLYLEIFSFRSKSFKKMLIASIGHFAVNLGVVVLIMTGLYLYTFFSSGSRPYISFLSLYSNLFYVQGYYMLPIPSAIHPWNALILAYICGLFIAIRSFFEVNQLIRSPFGRQNQEAPIWFFSISILGVGLFNYYVGRSADPTLIGPAWPAILLITFFADRLLSYLLTSIKDTHNWFIKIKRLFFSRQIFITLLFSGIFAFLSFSILNSIFYLPYNQNLVARRQAGIDEGVPLSLQNKIDLINANKKPESQVIIFSHYAPELYLYTKTPRALPIPSFIELVLRSDLDKIIQFIEHSPDNAQVYLDLSFGIAGHPNFKRLLLENMRQTSSTEDGRFILFEKKSQQ